MSVVAAAVVTSAAVGAYGAKQAAKAQDRATAAAESAASEQNQLSREQFEWNQKIYERDVAPLQQRQQELQEKVANDALARAAKQDALADEQNQYYKETFQPLEKQVVDEAKGYDSEANVNKRSGMAAANVNQQFSNARGQSARMAGRYGLGSTSFSGPAGASERAQALGAAGAATGAAFETKDKAIQLRAGAANFGRNMTNTALNGWGGANSSSGVAGGAANSALNGAVTSANFMNNAYGNRMNGISSSTGLLTSALNSSANMWGNVASGFGQVAGGLFQKAGGFKGFSMPSFGGSSGAFVDQGGMGAASNAALAEYGI